MLQLDQFQLLLGSKSPRRAELLKFIAEDFKQVKIDVDEDFPKELHHSEVAEYLAVKKSKAYLKLEPSQILLTADTIVILNSKILGKPESREDAIAMLSELSGHTHEVATGVCIRSAEDINAFATSTMVRFVDMSRAEIEHYVDQYQPFDKAGSYGIQEWIGAVGVSEINGSFYNVMGLPVHQLYHNLKAFVGQ